MFQFISSNLEDVRGRIDAAAQRFARDPSEVKLVAVSKTHPADAVRAATRFGAASAAAFSPPVWAGERAAFAAKLRVWAGTCA